MRLRYITISEKKTNSHLEKFIVCIWFYFHSKRRFDRIYSCNKIYIGEIWPNILKIYISARFDIVNDAEINIYRHENVKKPNERIAREEFFHLHKFRLINFRYLGALWRRNFSRHVFGKFSFSHPSSTAVHPFFSAFSFVEFLCLLLMGNL